MSERGILAFGAYIPRRRLPRKIIADAMAWANPALQAQAKGERAIRAWDEDSLTMAVEAARDCDLAAFDAPENLVLASTTLPYADRDNAAVIVAALGLDECINTLDMTASLRAGTAALANALRAGDGPSLVIASDCRDARPASPQEMQIGHGATAMLVGGGDGLLARALAHRAISRDLVDHYRAQGERFDYTVEGRWLRDEGFFKLIPETVRPLLAEAAVSAETIDHVIFPCPARVAGRLCKTLGLLVSALADDLVAQCGDTGTTHPLLLLARVLEQATPGAIEGHLEQRREETSYLRYLAHQGAVTVDWGNRAEFDNRTALTALYRNRDSVTGFTGGRCSQCGTVQFPSSRYCVNPDCRELDTQEPVSLSDMKGQVKSFTEDWLAYCPNPPLQYGNVEIEGGGNIMMEFCDCEPGTLRIGMPVEMQFRIKDVDHRRNFTRYFWKATPVQEA